MTSKTKDSTSVRVCHSCGSFGRSKGKTAACQCQSSPFLKPTLSLHHVTLKWLKKLSEIFKGSHEAHSKTASVSLEDCKCIIRELAAELERVLQNGSGAAFSSVREDGLSQEESQHFVLEWAEELKKKQDKDAQEPSQSGSCTDTEEGSRSEEQKPTVHTSPGEDERLKEAQHVLRQWAFTLRSLPEGSVHPGEGVYAGIKELKGQWKKGRLSSILPVMDFIVWAVIQERPEEGALPQLWLRTKQRSSKTAALKYIPDSVWNWIREASVEIILDPTSANSDLLMSSDRKQVKMNTIIENDDNIKGTSGSTQQYNGWWCVLGMVGFTTGRHYWEVGVQGKREWRIGLVRESAPRKGFVNLNTETGYWTLRLQLGLLMALTVPVTKLQQSPIPSRVGVHLDMEEGQLSFYDVERRCHIYTFREMFTERVFPVFGTTETDQYLVLQ